jgi:hypothetical protein
LGRAPSIHFNWVTDGFSPRELKISGPLCLVCATGAGEFIISDIALNACTLGLWLIEEARSSSALALVCATDIGGFIISDIALSRCTLGLWSMEPVGSER